MGQIWKAVPPIIFVLFLAFVSIFVISGNNDANAADAYLQKCATELQICNFNDTVIDQLKAEAQQNGYKLSVEKMVDSYGDVMYATIELTYTYDIAFIQMDKEHTKTIITK